MWERSAHTVRGRDGCRVPIPWDSTSPAFGFSPTGATWLPQPAAFAGYALDNQRGVPGSTYEMYRTALHLRRAHGLGQGSLTWAHLEDSDTVVTFRNGPVLVVANLGAHPVALPAGAVVLLASGELTVADDGAAAVPQDTTAWVSLT